MASQARGIDDVGAGVVEGSELRPGHSLQSILVDFPNGKGYCILGHLAECGIHL